MDLCFEVFVNVSRTSIISILIGLLIRLYFTVSSEYNKHQSCEEQTNNKRKVEDADLCDYRHQKQDLLGAIKERNKYVVIELLNEYPTIKVLGTDKTDRHWIYSSLHKDVDAYSYDVIEDGCRRRVIAMKAK